MDTVAKVDEYFVLFNIVKNFHLLDCIFRTNLTKKGISERNSFFVYMYSVYVRIGILVEAQLVHVFHKPDKMCVWNRMQIQLQ